MAKTSRRAAANGKTWQERLSFLKWSSNGGGPLLGRDRDTGAEGYRCKDGSIIPYDDPRVVEYSRESTQKFAAEYRAKVDSIYEAIAGSDEPQPISREYIKLRPKFIQWLNDGAPLNDDGTPAAEINIAEFKIVYPAYEEWRLNRRHATSNGVTRTSRKKVGAPVRDTTKRVLEKYDDGLTRAEQIIEWVPEIAGGSRGKKLTNIRQIISRYRTNAG